MKRSTQRWLSSLLVSAALCAPGSAAFADGEASKAAALFEEGAAHYRAGRFEQAVTLLSEAYALAKEPVLLFNLAKAHEGKGDLPAAIAAYEQYLTEATDVPDRGAIEARLSTLRAQLSAREALEKKAEEERQRADRLKREGERAPSPVPWILAGAGVAGLATGIALGAFASSTADDANAEPEQRRAAELADEAQTFATAANVAFAIGGALLGGGATWGIVDVALAMSGGSDGAARARLWLVASPGSLMLVTSF